MEPDPDEEDNVSVTSMILSILGEGVEAGQGGRGPNANGDGMGGKSSDSLKRLSKLPFLVLSWNVIIKRSNAYFLSSFTFSESKEGKG